MLFEPLDLSFNEHSKYLLTSSLLANCVLLLTGSLQFATSHSADAVFFPPSKTEIFWIFSCLSEAVITVSAYAAVWVNGQIRFDRF